MSLTPKRRQTNPISLIFRKGTLLKHWTLHCPKCGLPIIDTNQELTAIVDNPYVDENKPYHQVMCKRCKQFFRISVL